MTISREVISCAGDGVSRFCDLCSPRTDIEEKLLYGTDANGDPYSFSRGQAVLEDYDERDEDGRGAQRMLSQRSGHWGATDESANPVPAEPLYKTRGKADDLRWQEGMPCLKSISIWGCSVLNSDEDRLTQILWRNRLTLEKFVYLPTRTKGGVFPRPLYWNGDRMGRAAFPHVRHIMMDVRNPIFPANFNWIGTKELRTMNLVLMVGCNKDQVPSSCIYTDRVCQNLLQWFRVKYRGTTKERFRPNDICINWERFPGAGPEELLSDFAPKFESVSFSVAYLDTDPEVHLDGVLARQVIYIINNIIIIIRVSFS